MGQSQFKGKGHDRAAHYGAIYVKLDQPHYYAGEQVTGKVYLMLNQLYPGSKVNLKLKGKEKTLIIWTESVTETDQQDGTSRTTHREVEEKDSATCLKQTVNIYTFPGGQYLPPGQYEFPFSFRLPDGIPGTFHQQEYNLSASIYYKIEGFLEPADSSIPKLKYKNLFTVREPVREAIQSVNKVTNTEVVCCGCCMRYGTVGISASFERNTYCPSDEAKAIVQVDNKNCSKDVSSIALELRQVITVKAKSRTETRSHSIVSNSVAGVKARQVAEPRLNSIRLPPAPDLNAVFLEGEKRIRDAKAFSNKTINSTTNGVLIQSKFLLEAKATPDACCSNTAVSSIPCHIVYPDYRFPVVEAPPNWNPQVMNPYNFSATVISGYAPPIPMNTNLMPGGMQQGNSMGINAYPSPQQQPGYPNAQPGGNVVIQTGYPGPQQQQQNAYPGPQQNNNALINVKMGNPGTYNQA